MSASMEKGQKLFAVLFQRDAKGNRVFSDQEIRDLIAVFTLQGKLSGDDVPTQLNGVLGDFALRIGIKPEAGENQGDLPAMLLNYLKKNPLNRTLVDQVSKVLGVS